MTVPRRLASTCRWLRFALVSPWSFCTGSLPCDTSRRGSKSLHDAAADGSNATVQNRDSLPCSAGQLYSYTTSLAKPAGTASDGLWYRTVHPPGPLHVDDWRTSGVVILIEVCRA